MALRETLVQAALARFLASGLDEVLACSATGEAERRALALFESVAATVPAYRTLLAEHGIDPALVRTVEDFRTLPLLTKDNYLRRHPLVQLCRAGQVAGCDMIAVSSGSTGEPTFWPRSVADEFAVATRFEQVFQDSFDAGRRATLAVVCFALGTWVGGMYTASCCRHLAAKGYPITVITPGSNVEEILRVVTALGPQFEQVVLLGYPPFLKGVVDTGLARGVPWPDYHVKLITAGEVFSEEWRTLLGERLGGGSDPCFGSASLYGTADAGVLANETPLSICIRRYLAEHPAAARELFGQERLPTLAQYDPRSRLFETHEQTLLFTGDGGIPLIRYHIADTGGLTSFDAMLSFLADHGFDPIAELGAGRQIREMPFVHVFGRSQFAVSYYGANIYPENIAVGLEQPTVAAWITGKFVMESREDADRDRHLAIAVELATGVDGTEQIRAAIAESILVQLRRLNSEFAHYTPAQRQLPQVSLHRTGDPEYFPPGVKHRYSRYA